MPHRPDQRSFGEAGRYNSDEARWRGAEDQDYGPAGPYRPQPAYRAPGYAGQEYGLGAGGPDSYRDVRRGPGRNQGRDQGRDHRRDLEPTDEPLPYGDRRLPDKDPGVRAYGPPADYAYRPDEDDLHPDYLSWREARMREHDDEYAAWREDRRRRYDEAHRSSRRSRPGQHPRAHLPTGAPVASLSPGGSGGAGATTWGGGYGDRFRNRPWGGY